MNIEDINKLFVNECGFFGINLNKITRIEKYPDADCSLLLYFDNSKTPCIRLRHRTRKQMDVTYSNIVSYIENKTFAVIDINEYRNRRGK